MSRETIKDRVPPNNIEAERAVLGSMLVDEQAVTVAMEMLDAGNFYRQAHQKIFKSMMNLFQTGDAIDVITVAEDLKKNGELDAVGGGEYLTYIVNSVTTAANIEYYAVIVRDKSLLRELIRVSSRTIEQGYSETEDIQSIFDRAEQEVFNIRTQNVKQGFRQVGSMVENSIETIERICNHDEEVSGVSTGFAKLDQIISGLHKGNLVILAGRPSMGKTSFGLNIAHHVGLQKKIPVGIFSLEMSSEEILQRLLCAEAKVSLQRVRDGYIGSNEWAKLTTAAGRLKDSKIFIDDSASMTPLEAKARARRLKSQHPDLGLILIDYIQLMSAKQGAIESRQQEITYISRNLKILAKEIEVPVIAMSQLSRAPEQRGGEHGARPRLSDLRESGAIEQDADVVLFLYRPAYYMRPDEVTPDNENIAQVIVGKQRSGPTGDVSMLFQKEYTCFRDLTRKQEN